MIGPRRYDDFRSLASKTCRNEFLVGFSTLERCESGRIGLNNCESDASTSDPRLLAFRSDIKLDREMDKLIGR